MSPHGRVVGAHLDPGGESSLGLPQERRLDRVGRARLHHALLWLAPGEGGEAVAVDQELLERGATPNCLGKALQGVGVGEHLLEVGEQEKEPRQELQSVLGHLQELKALGEIFLVERDARGERREAVLVGRKVLQGREQPNGRG